jgi:hypothetical protein
MNAGDNIRAFPAERVCEFSRARSPGSASPGGLFRMVKTIRGSITATKPSNYLGRGTPTVLLNPPAD